MNKRGKYHRFSHDNFLQKNRRGQFYLLAAIVIIAIIIGFAAISNYARKKAPVRTYDVAEELGIEGGKVLDYGTYNEAVDNTELMEHFTTLYQEYAGEDKEIYYVFGNYEEITAYKYGEITTGTIDVSFGKTSLGLVIDARVKQTIDANMVDSEIKTNINNVDYVFELKPGENFYFIISQELEGEKYVVQG